MEKDPPSEEKKMLIDEDDLTVQTIKRIRTERVKHIPLSDIPKGAVLTNGCFDLLHIGHIMSLRCAATMGTLVVGINSDASMRRIKREPAQTADERAQIVAALEFVDYVFVFDGDTPVKEIEILQPSIYVKGGDYDLDTINPEVLAAVKKIGGNFRFVPFFKDRSSSLIISRIRAMK